VRGISGSISVRSVARRTFAADAGRASVLLPAAAVTVVIALFTGVVVKLAGRRSATKPAAPPHLEALRHGPSSTRRTTPFHLPRPLIS
jgi:hypothetical protein